MIGDDGEGYELGQALHKLPMVVQTHLVACAARRTPTYTKPMLCRSGEAPRELNRLDIKNRQPLPREVEEILLEKLPALWESVDALLVLDQVSEVECGVVTARVRERLAEMGERDPGKIVIADSRERIGLFRNVWLKPNERECLRAVGSTGEISGAITALAKRTQRPVFCTCSERGMLVAENNETTPILVPAYTVQGPIDPVGAGDSSSAALACALAAGVSHVEAAAFANLIASITIKQIGLTGTASPEQIRARWREITHSSPSS
jgi:bifunctional ADP-heptose synthase (sugar kinase/adenylyltransferase)